MEEQGTKPNFLAGGRIVGDYAPFQLFAGEEKIVTDKGTVGAEAIAQYQVIALDADGLIVPFTGEEPELDVAPYAAIGVATNPAEADTPLPYYVSGFFNHAALEWPVGITTLAARKAVFARTTVRIGELPPAMPSV